MTGPVGHPGFSIDLAAVGDLPPLLDRRAIEVHNGGPYLTTNATVQELGPFAAIQELIVAHQRAVVDVGRALARCAERLTERATTVRAALRAYAAADQSSVEALSLATPLPRHHGRLADHLDAAAGTGSFDDPWIAAGHLTYPPDYDVEQPAQPEWDRLRGPAAAQHRLLSWLGTLDPRLAGPAAQEIRCYRRPARWLVGDWPGVLAGAHCLVSLAGALDAIQASVVDAGTEVERVWAGRAGAGCATALASDAARLDRIAGTLTALAAGYRPVAEAARSAEGSVESALVSLLDEAATAVLGVGSDSYGLPALVHFNEVAWRRLRAARHLATQAAATTAELTGQLAAHP